MSIDQPPFDVVISGTGPAGMIASLCAAKAGLSTALVGPAINLDDKRTTALLAPSLDTLDSLGLSEAVANIGTPLMTMRLMDGSRRLLRAPTVSFDAEEIGRALFGLNCPNAQLNQMLLDAVSSQSAIKRIEAMVVDYTLGSNPIAMTLNDGRVLHTQSVMAADGKNSPTRSAAGINVRRWSYPQTAAVGVVRHAKPHDFVSTEFHTETGPFTFVPMPDVDGEHRSSFVCALSPDDAGALAHMPLSDASLFLEKRAQHLFGALKLEEEVQLWPLEALVASAFAAKGIYLTGETAHAFPPIGAQGLNLSIRDGSDAVDVISSALTSGDDPTSMLMAARYSAKRRADVWARTFGVDALNRSLLSGNPLLQVGRAAAMSLTRLSPRLKKGLMVAGLEPFGLRSMVGAMRDVMRPAA
jgi:2-octaprenyl-6-methoxyphenol hydroxylase